MALLQETNRTRDIGASSHNGNDSLGLLKKGSKLGKAARVIMHQYISGAIRETRNRLDGVHGGVWPTNPADDPGERRWSEPARLRHGGNGAP